MSPSYNAGTLVAINVTFTDTATRQPADPTTVTLLLQLPDGTQVDLSDSVVRDDVGEYHADYLVSQAGFYQYQWTGAGAVVATVLGSFTVNQTTLTPPPLVPETTPTVSGFTQFIRLAMGIGPDVLPPGSPVIAMALAVAQEIANDALDQISPTIYTLAVYNLAGDNLINYAPDAAGAPPVDGSDPPTPYFAWARKQFNTNGFVSGVIQSSGDEGTNQSLVVQEAAKNFTMADLQNLKTPWGRQYLAFAQQCGPNVWGLS